MENQRILLKNWFRSSYKNSHKKWQVLDSVELKLPNPPEKVTAMRIAARLLEITETHASQVPQASTITKREANAKKWSSDLARSYNKSDFNVTHKTQTYYLPKTKKQK